MDTTNDNTVYETFLENTPMEIRNFLWGDAFTILVESISQPYKLTSVQTDVFKSVIFDIIIGYLTEAQSKNKLTEAGIPQSNQEKLFLLAYQYIINPILEITENTPTIDFSDEKQNKEVTPIEKKGEEISLDKQEAVLQNITNRLQKTTVIAPSKRTHTIEKMTEQSSTPHTDPYREIPE